MSGGLFFKSLFKWRNSYGEWRVNAYEELP